MYRHISVVKYTAKIERGWGKGSLKGKSEMLELVSHAEKKCDKHVWF